MFVLPFSAAVICAFFKAACAARSAATCASDAANREGIKLCEAARRERVCLSFKS